MDYKALIGKVRRALTNEEWGESHEASHADILALCDAVEALERDRERLVAKMQSVGMAGAVCRTHSEAVLVTHLVDGEPCKDYLLSGLFSALAPTASTPTPAAPSDA